MTTIPMAIPDSAGTRKSKMEASQIQVRIFKLVNKVAKNFRRLHPRFRAELSNGNIIIDVRPNEKNC